MAALRNWFSKNISEQYGNNFVNVTANPLNILDLVLRTNSHLVL